MRNRLGAYEVFRLALAWCSSPRGLVGFLTLCLLAVSQYPIDHRTHATTAVSLVSHADVRGLDLTLYFDSDIRCGRSGCLGFTVLDASENRSLPIEVARTVDARTIAIELNTVAKPGSVIRVGYQAGNVTRSDFSPLPPFSGLNAANLSQPSPFAVTNVDGGPIITQVNFSGSVRCGSRGCSGFSINQSRSGTPTPARIATSMGS